MSAHGVAKDTVCPKCNKSFVHARDCRTHMKRKGHTLDVISDEYRKWPEYDSRSGGNPTKKVPLR